MVPGTQNLGVLNGVYADFTTDWYGAVGVTFVLILIVDNVVNNLVKLVKAWIKRILRVVKQREVRSHSKRPVTALLMTLHIGYFCRVQGKCVTQRELDAAFVGEPFDLQKRIPQVGAAPVEGPPLL